MKAARSLLTTVVPGIRGMALGALNVVAGLVGLFVILLYVIFLLADFGRIKANWQEYLPKGYREGITGFLGEFEKTMGLYFRGQIIVCLLVGVLMSTGFLLIGLPLGLVLGMLIGLLNIAPYLGVAGAVPAVLLAALNSLEAGESVWIGIGLVVAVMSVVQVIQDVVLVPKIQGESLGLSPWLILLSLSVWGKLLGFLGLLIALPMSCLCLSYYRRMLAEKEIAP
jgi:predicted PurR-regulated permease PerM